MSNKIAVITDLHLDAHKGDERYWNYFSKFYNKTFFPYLKEHNIEDILILGDVIDNRKMIDFNVLRRIREEFFKVLNNYRVNIILGNHDVYYRTTNEVSSLESLLNEYENITVHKKPIELFLQGTKFFLLPWVNNFNEKEFLEEMNKSNAEILCAHLEINRGEMYKGVFCEKGLDSSLFSKFKQVWSGHFHHRNKLENIQYIGNPYELYWNDYGDERGFSVFNPITKTLKFIKNPFSIYSQIIYDDKENNYRSFDYSEYNEKFIKVFVKRKNSNNIHNKFIENLYKNGVYDVKIIDNINEFNPDEITIKDIKIKSTIDIFNDYIDEIDIETNKLDLKNEIKDLYEEALMTGE